MYNLTHNSNNIGSSQVSHFIGIPPTLRNKKQIKIKFVAPKKMPPQATNVLLYKYIDSHTSKAVRLSKVQLLKLGREFVIFARESNCLFIKTFWEKCGITREVVKTWCKHEPDFKMLFEFGVEIVKCSRAGLAANDVTYLRNTASLYIPEYKEYETKRLEVCVRNIPS